MVLNLSCILDITSGNLKKCQCLDQSSEMGLSGQGGWVLEMLPGDSSLVGSSGGRAVGSTGRLSWRWPVCRSAGGKDTSPHWGITEPGPRAWRLVSAHVSRERETGPFGWSLARICRLDAQGAGFGLPGGQWKAGSEAGLASAEHPPQPWSWLGPVVPSPPPCPLPPNLGARADCQASGWEALTAFVTPVERGGGWWRGRLGHPRGAGGLLRAAVKGTEVGRAGSTQTAGEPTHFQK